PPALSTLALHDALPICETRQRGRTLLGSAQVRRAAITAEDRSPLWGVIPQPGDRGDPCVRGGGASLVPEHRRAFGVAGEAFQGGAGARYGYHDRGGLVGIAEGDGGLPAR